MEIRENITVKLNASDVKGIVVKYLREKGYNLEESDVSINVGSHTTGYFTSEHSEPCFESITAKVTKNN